jgi:hypothetical protein
LRRLRLAQHPHRLLNDCGSWPAPSFPHRIMK